MPTATHSSEILGLEAKFGGLGEKSKYRKKQSNSKKWSCYFRTGAKLGYPMEAKGAGQIPFHSRKERRGGELIIHMNIKRQWGRKLRKGLVRAQGNSVNSPPTPKEHSTIPRRS